MRNYRPLILSVSLLYVHFSYFPKIKKGFHEIAVETATPDGDITGYVILDYFGTFNIIALIVILGIVAASRVKEFNHARYLLGIEVVLFIILICYLLLLPLPILRFVPMEH